MVFLQMQECMRIFLRSNSRSVSVMSFSLSAGLGSVFQSLPLGRDSGGIVQSGIVCRVVVNLLFEAAWMLWSLSFASPLIVCM